MRKRLDRETKRRMATLRRFAEMANIPLWNDVMEAETLSRILNTPEARSLKQEIVKRHELLYK